MLVKQVVGLRDGVSVPLFPLPRLVSSEQKDTLAQGIESKEDAECAPLAYPQLLQF